MDGVKRIIRDVLLGSAAAVLASALFLGGFFRMAHGTPDWYNISPVSTVHLLGDLGELAARLDSPVKFDRRGNVIYLDRFEDGLTKWTLAPGGNYSDIYLTALEAHEGAYSVRMIGDRSQVVNPSMLHHEPYPVESQYGVEMAWLPGADFDKFYFLLRQYDGTNLYDYGLRYDDTSGKLEYYSGLNTWTEVASGVDLTFPYNPWAVWKVVIDLEKRQYVRCFLNQDGYPLPGLTGRTAADASAPHLRISINQVSTLGSDGVTLIDAVILTQNEP